MRMEAAASALRVKPRLLSLLWLTCLFDIVVSGSASSSTRRGHTLLHVDEVTSDERAAGVTGAQTGHAARIDAVASASAAGAVRRVAKDVVRREQRTSSLSFSEHSASQGERFPTSSEEVVNLATSAADGFVERFPTSPEEVVNLTTSAADGFAASVPPFSFHRGTRIVLTATLCLFGLLSILVHGGWIAALVGLERKSASDASDADDASSAGGWRHVPVAWRRSVVLLDLLGRILLLHPLIEHVGHRALHAFSVHGHANHHIEVALGLNEYTTFEAWPYLVASLAYPLRLTRPAAFGLLQYAWFHQMSHDWPALALPGTAEAHMLHHKNAHFNFDVSWSLQHWPDVLFGSFAGDEVGLAGASAVVSMNGTWPLVSS